MSLFFICSFIYRYFAKFRYFRILEITPARNNQPGNFTIKLKTKYPSEQLVLDEIWIDDRLYRVKVTDEDNRQIKNEFGSKQILHVLADNEIQYPEEKTRPGEKSKSKIFLGYQVGNKRRYHPIRYFTEGSDSSAVA